MVLCLMRSPTTEHTLILIIGLFICSSMRLSKDMKTLLMSELLTLELMMMLSKYYSVLIFSFIVVLLAIEVYTSLRWLSISAVLMLFRTCSVVHGINWR